MNTSTKSIAFDIDSIAPVITSVTGNAAAWQKTDVTLTVAAGDNGSGLAAAAYSFDGGATWQTENTKVYGENQTIAADTIRVKDAVGNVQNYSSEIAITKIDKTNPGAPTVALNGNEPDTGWYNVFPTIGITAPTHVAATAPETTYYKLWNTSAATDNTEPENAVALNARIKRVVAANTQPTIDQDGVWMLKTWTEDGAGNTSTPSTITINVDTTAPEGDVNIDENSVKTFLNTITFGLFFNQNVDVTLSATDAMSGVASIEYYKSSAILDQQAIEALTSWIEFTGTMTETAVDATRFIYYVKITDQADNVTYFASSGTTFDTTNPAITGITNGAVYYVNQAVAVTDTNLDTITLNGNPLASGDKLTGNLAETYTITATDKAGNTTTSTVTMKPIASLSTDIDSLSVDHVKSSDKTVIEAVAAHVKAVLLTTSNGASQAQIDELQAILDQCNDLLAKIQDVKEKIEDVDTRTNGITTDNVKSSDQTNLEQALATINELLASDNLTDTEIQTMEEQIDSIKIILNTLDQVADVENLISTLPNPANIVKTDVAAVFKAYDAYETLTDHQKRLVDAVLKAKLDEAGNALTKILLFDVPTGTRLDGVDGTVFDLRTELVVTPVSQTLDTDTMRKFSLGVSHVAAGQQIAQLYDIKLMLDGQEIQPDGRVKITLTLTDEQANYSNLQIIYIADDGTATIIPSKINGKEISFVTDHFSYYGMIGTPIPETDPDASQMPKTGESKPVFPLVAFSFLSAALLLILRIRKSEKLEQ